jgi:anion-transporting  ArsA/GET3 family ATPase
MFDLFEKRFILNTGKGGVGKTTVSAAIALAAARRGKRVLLMDMSSKERFSRMFGSVPLTSTPREVEENLFALRITPQEALEEYEIMKLRHKTLYKAVFENRFIRTFLRVIPGLNELTLLGKAWHEEQARHLSGRPVWDMIIVDAPATGHGIFFLQIPDVICSMVNSGPMFQEARQISELVHDPIRTAINLVTLVEEMPVNETIELKERLSKELKVPLGFVVANAVYPPLFDAEENLLKEARRQWPTDGGDVDKMLDAAAFRHKRVQLQRSYLDRIDTELTLPKVHIPYYFTERFNFMTISKIADQIDHQASAHARGESPSLLEESR